MTTRPDYGTWHTIDDVLPEIDPLACRSDDVLGLWDNSRMATVYYDAVDMQWKDAEEGLPVETMKNHPEHWQTILTHWCKLPPLP